jgi:RimJ/RimL family protein N-acetyltransferase
MGEPDVALKPFSEEHIEATFAWLRNADLRRQIDSLGEPTRNDHDRYWHDRIGDPNRPCFAITSGGKHVGNCGLVLDRSRSKAELWMYLGLGRGRGVGRRAASLLLEYVFDELVLHRAYIRVIESNKRALRFWRTLGFVDEGHFRADTRVDDIPTDSVVLSMLTSERAVGRST